MPQLRFAPQYNVAVGNNMRTLTNTTPYTWANGDQYNVGLMTYEAA